MQKCSVSKQRGGSLIGKWMIQERVPQCRYLTTSRSARRGRPKSKQDLPRCRFPRCCPARWSSKVLARSAEHVQLCPAWPPVAMAVCRAETRTFGENRTSRPRPRRVIPKRLHPYHRNERKSRTRQSRSQRKRPLITESHYSDQRSA